MRRLSGSGNQLTFRPPKRMRFRLHLIHDLLSPETVCLEPAIEPYPQILDHPPQPRLALIVSACVLTLELLELSAPRVRLPSAPLMVGDFRRAKNYSAQRFHPPVAASSLANTMKMIVSTALLSDPIML